jgi:hypothetical protein
MTYFELRTDPDDPHPYLDSRRVQLGYVLDLFAGACGWIRGRYEWTGDSEDCPALLLPNENVILLDPKSNGFIKEQATLVDVVGVGVDGGIGQVSQLRVANHALDVGVHAFLVRSHKTSFHDHVLRKRRSSLVNSLAVFAPPRQ